MSLPHALLTALMERPGAGLELADRFDRSIGYFWKASHQQIYRELAKLENNGWVKSTAVEGAKGGKKNYEILPAGRHALIEWIANCPTSSPVRDEMLVKLRAESVVRSTYLTGEMKRLRDLHQGRLENYRKIEQKDFIHKNGSREQRLKYMILRAGIDFEKLRISWCDEAIEILSEDNENK